MSLEIEQDGAERYEGVIDPVRFCNVLSALPQDRAGIRLRNIKGLSELLAKNTIPSSIVANILRRNAKPVRALLFDKSEVNNWALGWHQDRTIAVIERLTVDGFHNWSMKNGVQHVEPPFDVLKNMVTLRIHLDGVDHHNAPLRIAPGSHKLGRIAETSYESIARQCGVRDCLANAGDIWAYSTPILHASEVTKNPRRRRVLQIDYSPDELPGGLLWAGL